MRRWLQVVGVSFMLMALPYAATGYGLLIAWVPVWLGVVLFQAARIISREEEDKLLPFIDKLQQFFILFGVLVVALLAFTTFILITRGTWMEMVGW